MSQEPAGHRQNQGADNNDAPKRPRVDMMQQIMDITLRKHQVRAKWNKAYVTEIFLRSQKKSY